MYCRRLLCSTRICTVRVGFTQARTYDGQLIVGSTAIHRGYEQERI